MKENNSSLGLFQELLADAPCGVGLFDIASGKAVYLNRVYYQMVGYTEQEYARLHTDRIFPPDQSVRAVSAAEFAQSGKALEYDYRIRQKSGALRWFRMNAVTLHIEGEVYAFVSFVDITTEKDAHRRLELVSDEIAQYQSIVEDSAIGVFVADRKKRQVFYTNAAFHAICGIADKNLAGQTLETVLVRYQKKELLTAEEVASLSFDGYKEFHVERRGIYMGIKAKAVIWNDVDSYILYITDETEVMSAHAEMERNYIKEQTLMDSIPGGAAVYRAKKNGTIVVDYASDGYCRLLGCSKEEILAMPDITGFVHPEDLEATAAVVQQSLDSRQSVSTYYRIVTKSGEVVLNKLDAKIMDTEELGAEDAAVLYAVHSRVTDEAQLMMQEQKYYRMALSLTGTAYCEWDAESGFYASKEYKAYQLSNEGYESLMGRGKSKDAIHPEDLPLVKHYMRVIENNESGQPITIRLKMQDGHYQWTEVVAVASKNAEGKFTKLVGIFRDVDKEWIERNRKLQKALDAAEKANRAKTAFLSRVSHDMRTPLNGILGLTSFLKESVTDEKIARDVAQLELSGQYLLNLINDTLDVSRIENGKLELHPVICDEKETFDNIIKLVKPNVDAKQQEFVVNTINIHFAKLFVDVGRVEQILMNIIGNAVKFTPAGGTIVCTMEQLEENEDTVVNAITIQDTGIGMSKEFLPNIFDAFSQAENNLTTARQGTGLGMAITKQLVDLMNGTIQVESELGKGSSFRIVLPFKKATREQVAAWEKSLCKETDNSILTQKRVLLCEDHPLNREIATRLLHNKGMQVECAENGKIGLAMYEASATDYYDLILMDIRMPEMDGLDTTRAIRKLARADAHTIPIVAMTGNSFDEDIAMTYDAGMNAHLSKPVDSVKLFETLREQLSNKTFFRRKRILLVDDIEANRAVLYATAASDYDLLEADDGEQALEILRRETPIDLVITDMMMQRMDGYALIRAIRADPKLCHLAILANTQYDEMTKESELLQLGANAVLYKPNTPEDIMKKIHQVLAR